jgi:hypothetical protein
MKNKNIVINLNQLTLRVTGNKEKKYKNGHSFETAKMFVLALREAGKNVDEQNKIKNILVTR